VSDWSDKRDVMDRLTPYNWLFIQEADIPGMAWAAKFYLTHYIHYLGAIFPFALIAYAILDYILSGRKKFSLTASTYLRIALFWGGYCSHRDFQGF
jgi:hypothetical protein